MHGKVESEYKRMILEQYEWVFTPIWLKLGGQNDHQHRCWCG